MADLIALVIFLILLVLFALSVCWPFGNGLRVRRPVESTEKIIRDIGIAAGTIARLST